MSYEDYLRMKSMVSDLLDQMDRKVYERQDSIREEYQSNPNNNRLDYYALEWVLLNTDLKMIELRKLRADTLAWYYRITYRGDEVFRYFPVEERHPRAHATIARAMLRRK